ncbi:MAG: hypothetical protein Q9187_001419 [Circinaria calcarea]
MIPIVKQLSPRPSPEPVNLEKLVVPQNIGKIPKVNYAYDPVPNVPSYLHASPMIFPNRHIKSNDAIRLNAVPLYPHEARLPYRSSFGVPHGARAWEANFHTSVKLLGLLAADKSAADVEVDRGITIAKLARKELRPGIENGIMLATAYMFPGANQRRIELIAASMIYYFIFDDSREPPSSTASDLKRYMDGVVRAVEEEDRISGNGGTEMLNTLRAAFRCVHPEKDFQSISHYQSFRNLNIGAAFVIAAAKFSIGSNANASDPRFARYLSFIGDHLGLINDIHSYDKELRAFECGDTSDMINVVAVIKRLMSLPSHDAAKIASYTYLLQVEAWIMEELEYLAVYEHLTDEEWLFLEACFLSAAGNTFFCMVSARYGGEAARIDLGMQPNINGHAAKTDPELQRQVHGYAAKTNPELQPQVNGCAAKIDSDWQPHINGHAAKTIPEPQHDIAGHDKN